MSPRRQLGLGIVAVIAMAVPVYLVGNGSAPLLDRDEPRYAQCSREMLLGSPEHPGSDFVVPRLRGELRTAKPPLVYWCQAATYRVMEISAFSARFPSTVAAIATLALWALACWQLAGPTRAVWSTFILASSMLFVLTAKWCTTDAILLLFATTAQLCLYAIWRRRFNWLVAIALGVAVGLAGLTKGPVVLGVMGMTFLFLQILRAWEWWQTRHTTTSDNASATPVAAYIMRLLVALAIVLAIVAPWLILIHQREPGFLPRIIGHDVVKRIQTGLEGHSGPPGYHLLTVWGTYFPWSILLPLSIVWGYKRRHLPIVRFALCAVIGPWLMFEIVQTKLPHYLLPVFPWLSLMTADVIVRSLRRTLPDLHRRSAVVIMAVFAGIPLILSLIPWLAAMKFTIPVAPSTLLTLGGLAISGTIIALLLRRCLRAAFLAMGIGNLVLLSLIWGVYLPRADYLRASILTAEELHRRGLVDAGEVVMLGYKEPSLAFYQGGTIREHSSMKLTPALRWRTPPHLVISDQVWTATATTERESYEILAEYPCLNYAGGMKVQRVMIVRRK
jgi:4-amino-4-deoxy-L-arabinose transferase-like glycosyltransferase